MGAGSAQEPMFTENAFTTVMLDYLADRDVADDAVACHFTTTTSQGGRAKINAWHYDDEDGVVTLCISRFEGTETPRVLRATEVEQAYEQALRFFRLAMEGHHHRVEPAAEGCGIMRRLYEERQNIATVQLVLFTDAILPTASPDMKKSDSAYHFRYDAWDLVRLHRVVASGRPYEAVTIDLRKEFGTTLPTLSAGRDVADHRVHLALIPGRVLSDLYDRHGSRLLDLNVRSFLQVRGKVNKGIRETLGREPERFLAYNNGISATAEHIELGVDDSGTPAILRLTGFQVVNGGQTMASIHRAARVDRYDLSKVMVQAKITEVRPEALELLAPLISRHANSQNRVSDADFSSNDPFNVEVQRLSKTIWIPGEQSQWFYERTRGQYQVERFREGGTATKNKAFDKRFPASQRFSKTDLAKYLQCWDRLPHVVALGAQKNFVRFMDRLRQEYDRAWRPDEAFFKDLIAKAILFKAADKAARNRGISSYKANVVACMVALLSIKSGGGLDLVQVWNRQQASPGVIGAFDTWASLIHELLVRTAGTRNVTEWCKKKDSWEAVLSNAPEVPRVLLDELSEEKDSTISLPNRDKRSNGNDDPEEREKRIRVMRLDGPAWGRLSKWGRKGKRLKDWQCGIADTMAGYASGGWAKQPSIKQVVQAARILDAAAEHDFNPL